MNKTKRVAWHKHLKAMKRREEKARAAKAAAAPRAQAIRLRRCWRALAVCGERFVGRLAGLPVSSGSERTVAPLTRARGRRGVARLRILVAGSAW